MCEHPSYKCSICGRYKDNILDEQKIKIEYLENQLSIYKEFLQRFSISLDTVDYPMFLKNRIGELSYKFYYEEW